MSHHNTIDQARSVPSARRGSSVHRASASPRPRASYQSVNPANGKVLKTFAESSPRQLETALKTAARGFEIWRHKSYAQRAAVVHRAAALLRAHTDGFARLVTIEMGKLIAESRGKAGIREQKAGARRCAQRARLSPPRQDSAAGRRAYPDNDVGKRRNGAW